MKTFRKYMNKLFKAKYAILYHRNSDYKIYRIKTKEYQLEGVAGTCNPLVIPLVLYSNGMTSHEILYPNWRLETYE